MHDDPRHRLRGVLLAGVGVVALAAGGVWWQATAPTGSGVGAGPSSVSQATGWRVDPLTGARQYRGTDSPQPEVTATFRVDPATGASFWVDPATGSSLVLEMDGDKVRVLAGAGSGDVSAPETGESGRRRGGGGNVVWFDRSVLRPEEPVVRTARAADGDQLVLRVSCTGSGDVNVAVDGARGAFYPHRVECTGAVSTIGITAAGGPLRVTFHPGEAAQAQLVARLVSRS
ncbi:hypothetical protein [Verrucosispora sp. NA02020]|uniref:hypothetical protein n=1 Tax=Verrucosispora sp. NA02020 TaxID=2742132 RepID=UPI0015915CF0|nr:hypothetical protein [Verrucosispora sp. NA02020]QKW16591.1 hypothetical protein HUT12_30190 [Verrucosispora sp. NA02020]